MALVLAPELPLHDWLQGLDAQMDRAPAFFAGKPVVADLSALAAQPELVAGLLEGLSARGIRLAGLEGLEPDAAGLDLPPLLTGGRTLAADFAVPDPTTTAQDADAAPEPVDLPPPEPSGLLIDHPVRSGQTVMNPAGDVTVVGSVGSGAEVVAGGSIHIYGALRGRAVAGVGPGGSKARIFCRRLEAELLAIDGLYRTADDIERALHGKACQAWLEGDSMRVAPLD